MEIWNDIVAKLKQVGVDTSETKSNEKTGEKKKETLFDGQLPDADDYSVLSSVESSAPATVGSYENAASLSAAKATSSNMTTSSDGRLLRNGIPFTGLYDNKRYVAGQLFTGIHNGVEYENGVVKGSSDPSDPGKVPTAQKGTKEYTAQLLNLNLDNYDVAETDGQGRVTKLKIKDSDGQVLAGGEDYVITYDDTNNTVTIKTTAHGIPTPGALYGIEKTFDANGKLIREFYPENASLGPQASSTLIIYNNDGSKVETEIFNDASVNDGVKTVITTYKTDGKTVDSVKKYDADGKEIKDTDNPGNEPKLGEFAYVGKMLGVELDESKFKVTLDNTGKVKKIESKRPGGDSYLVAYGNDGEIKITEYKKDIADAVKIQSTFDKDGNLTKTLLYGGLNGDSVETLYAKDGKVTQKTVIYAEPKDNVAKVVTTYKADGVTVDSVKKFDADGKEINDYEVVPGQGQKPYENVISPDGTVYHVENFHLLSDAAKAKVIKILETKNNGVMAQGDVFYASITENADGSITVKNGVWGNVMWANDAWIPDESTFKFDNNGNITGFTVKEHQNTTEQATRVKEFDAQGNEINLPAAKKGSVEYVTQLLGENDWLTNNIDIYEPKFDEQGRVISLTFNPPASSSGVRPERPNVLKYDIEYAQDGTMTITAMGRSEEFDSVRKFDADGREIKNTPQIPAGEKGSIEYFRNLLGLKNPQQFAVTENIEYDNKGRVISISERPKYQTTDVRYNRKLGSDFTIKYNDDGSFNITKSDIIKHDAGSIHQKTLEDGTIIQVPENSKLIQSNVTVTNYDADGKQIDSTNTVIMADGIKTVKKYDANGNVTSVKKYDGDGKEITTLTGEVGSEEYLNALFFQNNLKFTNMDDYDVELDDQGRICKLVNKNTRSKSYEGDFSITYGDDGKITIENKDSRSWIDSPNTRTWTFDDGKMTQSELIYGKPENGVAKVVTTYDAEGSVISVKKFDADGHEIVQGPSGEKGSLEYAASLLGKKFNEDDCIITKDNNGNVIKIEPKETTTAGTDSSYKITYKDNGEIEIKEIPNPLLVGSVESTKTFNSEGRLIKETHPANPSLGPSAWSGETIYNRDGSSVYTKTFVDPSQNDGAVKEVVTYDKDGKIVKSKKFDADGNVISFKKFDAEGKALSDIPEGEQGSFTYFTKIISDMYNHTSIINEYFGALAYDDQGRITKLGLDEGRAINTIVPWFEIAYNNDGTMDITVKNNGLGNKDYPDGVYKFDANGNLISKPSEKQEFRDESGKLLYTVTDKNGESFPSVVGGKIKFSDTLSVDIPSSDEWVDVTISKDGFVDIVDNKNGNVTGYDKNGNKTGTKEYLSGLLGIDISKMDEVQLKDGKVTYFVDKSTYAAGLMEYEIEYGNNNSYTVTITKDGKLQEKRTVNCLGEVIGYEKCTDKGIETYQCSGDGKGTYTGKSADGKTTYWTIVDNYAGDSRPKIEDKSAERAQIVFAHNVWQYIDKYYNATINEDGTVIIKDKDGNVVLNFDKDGFQIVDNKKVKASEIGSAAYIQKFLKQDFDMESATSNVRYDSEGRVTYFIDRGADGTEGNQYVITYKDGKVDGITLTKTDGTVVKYDKDGKVVSSTEPTASTTPTTPTTPDTPANPNITDLNNADYPNASGNIITFQNGKKLTFAESDKVLINEVGKVHVTSSDGKIKVYTAIGEFCGTVVDNNSAEYPKLGGSVIYFSEKDDDYVRLVDGVSALIDAAGMVYITSADGKEQKLYTKTGTLANTITDNNGTGYPNIYGSSVQFSADANSKLIINSGEKAVINADGTVTVYKNNDTQSLKYGKDGKLINIKSTNANGTYATASVVTATDTAPVHKRYVGCKKDGTKTYAVNDYYNAANGNLGIASSYPCVKNNNETSAEIFFTANKAHKLKDGQTATIYKDGHVLIKNADGTLYGTYDKNGNALGSQAYLKSVASDLIEDASKLTNVESKDGKVTSFKYNGTLYKVSYTSAGSMVLKKQNSAGKTVKTVKYGPSGQIIKKTFTPNGTDNPSYGWSGSSVDGNGVKGVITYSATDKDGKTLYNIVDNLKGSAKPKVTAYDKESATITLANGKTYVVKKGYTAEIKADKTVVVKDANGKVVKEFNAEGVDTHVTYN